MSNPLPDLLALTSIADGSERDAAPLRNNYSLIQTAVNAIRTVLAGGTSGQVLEAADASNVEWAYPPGHQYAYDEFTGNVSVTATTEATANTIVTADAATFDGTPVWVEFFAPEATNVASFNLSIILHDDTAGASLGRLCSQNSPDAMTLAAQGKRKITPAAGSRVYSIRAYTIGGSAGVSAGAGGAGVDVPGYIRITKA